MPDKDEAQQQALDALRNAMGRCLQEGICVEIIDYLDQHRIDIVLLHVDWDNSNRTLRMYNGEQ